MKTITILKDNIERGKDGFVRILIDTYYYFEGSNALAEKLSKETGIKWQSFGCFMDRCCLATEVSNLDKLPDSFTFSYSWKE